LKKHADKIKRIGLIGNSGKAACAEIVRKAARLIQRAGRKDRSPG
jgi:aspartate aminotransferase-like enzyme